MLEWWVELYNSVSSTDIWCRTVLFNIMDLTIQSAIGNLKIRLAPISSVYNFILQFAVGNHDTSSKGHVNNLGVYTLTLLCLWWSTLTMSVVQHILRSEELALSTISWWQKLLLSRCVLLFSVSWITLWSFIDTNCDQITGYKSSKPCSESFWKKQT